MDIEALENQSPDQFLQSKLEQNQSFRDFSDEFSERYPDVLLDIEGYERNREARQKLPNAIAQQRAFRDNESTMNVLGRNIATKAFPYVSSVLNLVDSEHIKDATNRMNAGTATDSDYAAVARRQVQEEIDKKESTVAAIGKAAFHLPALVGEMGIGGKALGGIARAAGYGGKAAAVAEGAAPTVAKTFWQAPVAGTAKHLGQAAAITPAMPSTYLEQSSQRSAMNGGEWYDIKNLGPAAGMAVAQNAVLGTLQKGFSGMQAGGWLGRVGAKTAVAVPEQVAADTINGMVVEGVLGQKNGYGVTGEFWKANKNWVGLDGGTDEEKRQANKHAWTTLATFGMFSAMHGRYVPGKTKFLDGSVEELAKSYESEGMNTQAAQEKARQKTAELITQTIKNAEPQALPEKQDRPSTPDQRIEEAAKQPDLTMQDLAKRHAELQKSEGQWNTALADAIKRGEPDATIKSLQGRVSRTRNLLAETTKQMAEFRKNPAEQKVADAIQKIVDETAPAVKKPEGMSDKMFEMFRNNPELGRQVDPDTALLVDNPFATSKGTTPESQTPTPAKPTKSKAELDAAEEAEMRQVEDQLVPSDQFSVRRHTPVEVDTENRMKLSKQLEQDLADLRARQALIPGDPVTKEQRDIRKQIQKAEQKLAEAQDAELAPIPGGETYADHVLGKDGQGRIDLNPKGALADIVGGKTREEVRRNILEMVDTSTPEGRSLRRKVEQLTRLDTIGRRVVSLEELAPTMIESGDMVVRGGNDPSGQDAISHLLELIVTGKPMEGSGAEYANRERAMARDQLAGEREHAWSEKEQRAEGELDADIQEAKGPMPKEMFFSTSPYGPSAKQPSTARNYDTPTMVEVVSEIQQLPGVNGTIGQVPYSANAQNAQAIANVRSGTIIADKWSSSDSRVWMEDAAHILTGRNVLHKNGIETDPAKLPQDVRDGLVSFDGGRHSTNGVTSKTMVEGLGQWAVRRMTDDLVNLSPAEKAASDWAEQQYAPVKKQLDAIKDKFLKNATANPLDRGVVGSKPVDVPKKTWDKIVEWYDALRRNYDKSAQVITTMWRDAKSRGHKAAMDSLTKAARWVSVHNDQAVSRLANEIELKGAFEFDAQGRRVYADTKYGDIKTGLAPELVTLHSRVGKSASKLLIKGIRERLFGDQSDVTDFDTFMSAHHVTDEGAKFYAHEQAAKQVAAMPAGPAKNAAKQALDAMPKGFDPVKAVGADVYSIMKDQMAEFQKDPAVFQQLQEAHRKYVDVSNSLLNMSADKQIGLMNPTHKDRLIDKYEWYAPLGRIKQYQQQGQPNYLMGRKGSDEQIKAPMVVLKERIQSMAVKINQQMRIKGILDALDLGQMGHWGDSHEVRDLTTEGKQKLLAIDAAYQRGDITEAWRLEDESTKNDYLYKPWVEGGDNVLPIRGPDGNPTSIKIFDKQLYNLMASRQTEASQAAKAINWVSQWLPVKAPSKAVTFSASGGNAAFQLRNILLDMWSAARQTKLSANPAQMANEFRQNLGRAFRAEYELLLGKDASSKADRFLIDTFGRGMKALPFDQSRPSSAYEGVQANRGGAEKVANSFQWFKKLLNVAGAGEMGPRMREMYKYLETQGYSRDFIEAELKRHPERDPVPYDVLVDAAFYGQEVTGNFGEKGVIMQELGKAAPFLTAGIAGVRSALKTARDNPKRFAAFAAMALGLRLLHWYTFKDEDWYKNLNPSDKYQEFPIPINGVPYTIPGFKSRDTDVPIGSTTIATLDQMYNQDTKMKDAIDQSMRAMLPGITGEIASNTMKGDISTGTIKAGASIFGPALSATADIATNQNWMGRPIVPKRDQGLPDDEKRDRYKMPYFLGQMTANRSNAVGNMLEGDVQAKDAIKLLFGGMGTREVRPNKSVNDLYQRVEELNETSSRLKNRGQTLTPTQANELSRLERAAAQITKLSQDARGETRSKGVLLSKRKVSDDEKRAIAAQQVKIAREALGRK